MSDFYFDPSKHEASAPIGTVPTGTYNGVVTKAVTSKTANGNGVMLVVDIQVVAPATYAGITLRWRSIYQALKQGAYEDNIEITHRQLAGLCEAVGREKPLTSLADFSTLGKFAFQTTQKVSRYTKNGAPKERQQNDINFFMPAKEASELEANAPASQTAPSATPPASPAPQAAPQTTHSRTPWDS